MIYLAAAAVALALYAQGFARLRRRRRDLAPWWAAASFAGGVVVAVTALALPLEGTLTAHMTQHLLLGDVAPLLLAVGLIEPRGLFAVPPGVLRAVARTAWLRRLVRFLSRPSGALGVWLAVMYVWHVPAIYDATERHPLLHAAEHMTFVLAGLLVWRLVLDRRHSPGRRAAFAGAVLLAGMPLSELLIATHPLYAEYPSPAGQLHAGLLMMAEQVATLGLAALILLRNHVDQVGTVPANP